MRLFTKEELNELSKWETHFRTAVLSNYKRGTLRADDARIAEIYEAASGEKINKNFGCGLCNLNFYKKVGSKYFADKEKQEAIEYAEEAAKAATEIVEFVADLIAPKTAPETLNKNKTNKTKNNDITGDSGKDLENSRKATKRKYNRKDK